MSEEGRACDFCRHFGGYIYAEPPKQCWCYDRERLVAREEARECCAWRKPNARQAE
jgi:hypothetical protein